MTIELGSYYTKRHREAMSYILENLQGIETTSSFNDEYVIYATEEAYKVITALYLTDCVNILDCVRLQQIIDAVVSI